jgi:PhnB protein
MNSTATKPDTRKRATSHVPPEMHSVTPHLVCAGAGAAVDFYVKAFGAHEVARLPGPDGKIMHAEIKIGDSHVMLADEFPQCGSMSPKTLKGTPVTIHLYVKDADAVIQQAVAAGATVVMPAQDMFWGDRYGIVQDPFGHQWSVATHQYDLTPAQIQEGMKNACGGK